MLHNRPTPSNPPHLLQRSIFFTNTTTRVQDGASCNIAKLTMSSHTELRLELGNSLKGLSAALEEFARHVRREARAVWMWAPGHGGPVERVVLPALERAEALEAAARALLTIKYENDQDAHESRIAPGLLVLSAEGITLADDVNYWKDRLARALKAMNGIEVEAIINEETGERGPRPLREVALEGLQFRRLHYRQATRMITVLRERPGHTRTPDYVSFSWSSCKTVRRSSREALIEELSARLAAGTGSPRLLERDLALLRQLPEREPIAISRKAPPTVRVNVRWPPREGSPPLRATFSAVAPVVMLGERLPEKFRPLPAEVASSAERPVRADAELEDTQLLTTVPAFRYLRQYRKLKIAEPA